MKKHPKAKNQKKTKKSKKTNSSKPKYTIRKLKVEQKFKISDIKKTKNIFDFFKKKREKKLIKRSKDIETFFLKYYSELVRFCNSCNCSPHESEEIVQDAFALLITKYKESKKHSVRAWLYQTVYWSMQNYKKKEKNRERIFISVSYSDVKESEYYYTFTYADDLLTLIKKSLTEDEFEFFLKYILKSTDMDNSEEKDSNDDPSAANKIRIKKCRLKKKIHQILVDNDVIS